MDLAATLGVEGKRPEGDPPLDSVPIEWLDYAQCVQRALPLRA